MELLAAAAPGASAAAGVTATAAAPPRAGRGVRPREEGPVNGSTTIVTVLWFSCTDTKLC